MSDNIVKIPEENVSYAVEREDGNYEITLSAENILDLPRETAVQIIEYILEQWHNATHEIDLDQVVEPDDDQLEMGFDPYLGCYTEDC